VGVLCTVSRLINSGARNTDRELDVTIRSSTDENHESCPSTLSNEVNPFSFEGAPDMRKDKVCSVKYCGIQIFLTK
jgi:hypothetical protein